VKNEPKLPTLAQMLAWLERKTADDPEARWEYGGTMEYRLAVANAAVVLGSRERCEVGVMFDDMTTYLEFKLPERSSDRADEPVRTAHRRLVAAVQAHIDNRHLSRLQTIMASPAKPKPRRKTTKPTK
jgi:hypothetical protein